VCAACTRYLQTVLTSKRAETSASELRKSKKAAFNREKADLLNFAAQQKDRNPRDQKRSQLKDNELKLQEQQNMIFQQKQLISNNKDVIRHNKDVIRHQQKQHNRRWESEEYYYEAINRGKQQAATDAFRGKYRQAKDPYALAHVYENPRKGRGIARAAWSLIINFLFSVCTCLSLISGLFCGTCPLAFRHLLLQPVLLLYLCLYLSDRVRESSVFLVFNY
jgi:hypothetical protein